MKIKWWHYFSIGAFVAGWFSRAMVAKEGEAEGVITEAERLELGNGLVALLDQMFQGDLKIG